LDGPCGFKSSLARGLELRGPGLDIGNEPL
jgi:hypothetical protein